MSDFTRGGGLGRDRQFWLLANFFFRTTPYCISLNDRNDARVPPLPDGKTVLDIELQYSVDTVFDMIFTDSHFFHNFQVRNNFTFSCSHSVVNWDYCLFFWPLNVQIYLPSNKIVTKSKTQIFQFHENHDVQWQGVKKIYIGIYILSGSLLSQFRQ